MTAVTLAAEATMGFPPDSAMTVPKIDWTAMFNENRQWLETVVRARLGDAHAAEDVMQDLAIAILKQPNRPTEPQKVAPWLYRIALRKVINHRRFLGRQRRLMEGYSRHTTQSVAEEATNANGHWLMKEETAVSVKKALRQLNESDRQILMLKYTEGWSYKDLSDRLGISIKTVEYRLLRAREAMRDLLAGS